MDMRKLTSVLLFWALSLSLFAQNGLRVEAPAVVGLDARFNVTFIIEGDERPSSTYTYILAPVSTGNFRLP